MLEIINYTTDTARQFELGEATELEDYIEAHLGDEIGVSHCNIISINTLGEAIELLAMDEDEAEKLKVVAEHHGFYYYRKLEEAIAEFDELIYFRVDGATTLYEVAHKLNYTIGYEDDLNQILGCTAESYEQLGAYITDSDIENVLNVEYGVIFAGNNAYIML